MIWAVHTAFGTTGRRDDDGFNYYTEIKFRTMCILFCLHSNYRTRIVTLPLAAMTVRSVVLIPGPTTVGTTVAALLIAFTRRP